MNCKNITSSFFIARATLLVIVAAFPLCVWSQEGDTLKALKASRYHDDSWAFSLDSLVHLHHFEYDRFSTDTSLLNSFGYDALDTPVFPDDFYHQAFKELNAGSPIPYIFNQHVKTWIELYSERRRGLLSKVMGLSQVYFPIFEEALDKYGLPLELKYLAVIESALRPTAISRVGAGGLWQFMPGTARIYGLEVNNQVDERADPYLATEAACEHLSDLYDIFGDWLLALAAYNSGSGNVKKAMRLSGAKTFWEISRYLPKETRGYVPAFIAVSYIMSHPERYNIYPITPAWRNYEIDTVSITFPVYFQMLSDSLGLPVEDISVLNPSYLKGYIPAGSSTPRKLALPVNQMGAFMSFEPVAEEMAGNGVMNQLYAGKIAVENSRNVVHVVKKGESLGLIASKNHTTVTALKQMNHLRSNTIHPGQRLVVSIAIREVPAASMAGGVREVFRETFEYHTVIGGETLETIAGHYEFASLDELMRLNGEQSTDTILPVGSKIRLRQIQP